jgi:hypothetical protein
MKYDDTPGRGDYLGISCPIRQWFPDKGWRGWLCWKHGGNERRGWATLRKPFRQINWVRSKIDWHTRRFVRPLRCWVGWHHRWDVINLDASVTFGYCSWCKEVTKPTKTCFPDLERAAKMKEDDEKWAKWDDELDLFFAGTGPCPDCGSMQQHSEDCWLSPSCWEDE